MELPTPRLEFRWRDEPTPEEVERLWDDGSSHICDYGLVLNVMGDLRSNVHDPETGDTEYNVNAEKFYKFETTISSGCVKEDRAPYRDGVHAMWDSYRLGNLPIYIRSFDGITVVPCVDLTECRDEMAAQGRFEEGFTKK